MPRTKEQNEEIRRKRIEEILKAALRVYADKGYAATEIGDIAEAAGMARGLIYYYYKDKQALIQELFRNMITRGKMFMEDTVGRKGPVLPLLESYTKSLFESAFRHPEISLFFMRMGHDMKTVFPEQDKELQNWPHDYMDIMSEALERGMNEGQIRVMSPRLLTAQFWGAATNAAAYIQRKSKRMKEEGKTEEEIGIYIRREIDNALQAVLSMVRA